MCTTAGVLELLWDLCASSTPKGNIGRYSNEDIADEIGYDGDPDKLIEALVAAGWLDEDEEHRLVVHDWHEHCPRYVQTKVRRMIDSGKGGFSTVELKPAIENDDVSDIMEALEVAGIKSEAKRGRLAKKAGISIDRIIRCVNIVEAGGRAKDRGACVAAMLEKGEWDVPTMKTPGQVADAIKSGIVRKINGKPVGLDDGTFSFNGDGVVVHGEHVIPEKLHALSYE